MFEGLFMPSHMLLVLVVALFVFGPKKLPELGNTLGKSLREFKKALDGSEAASTSEPKKPDEKP